MCIRDRSTQSTWGQLNQKSKEHKKFQNLQLNSPLMATTTIAPPIKWAQRKDKLFVTIEARDIKDEKVDLIAPNQLRFVGTSDNQKYDYTLEFFGDIDVEKSKWNKLGLHLQLDIAKKESGPHWKRLTKEDKKFNNISIDWSKYIDEDDEDEAEDKGFSNWDPSSMKGFDGGDSDDDEDEGGHEGHNHGGDLGDLDKDEDIPAGKKIDEEEANEEKKEQSEQRQKQRRFV
eukprot:TRINITY_DN235_c0_g1_i1.p1 TRINITY_DN235_c0_g1~~TRINITY_DN235_c0_g1_i1.p1  ORF type:complete len:230 (+),score=85.65 TRINITY_DN235_c0_g1_i1:67-756(+)